MLDTLCRVGYYGEIEEFVDHEEELDFFKTPIARIERDEYEEWLLIGWFLRMLTIDILHSFLHFSS